MLYRDSAFRIMEAGVRATWLQQQLHTHNVANYETPNFKAKSMVFSDVLSRTRGADGRRAAALNVRIVEDEGAVVRPDGNNVDLDAESLTLYKAYVHYSMLLDKIRSEVNNTNYVVNNAAR